MNSTQPIDRPFTEEAERKPESSTGLMIELVLAVILAAGVLVRDVLGFPRTVVFPMSVALLLGAIYLFANWWINKPATTSFRTVAITILYGFTSFTVLFAFVFKFMYLPEEPEMTILGFVLMIITGFLDRITSIKKTMVGNKRTTWRFALLSIVILLYAQIDDDSRIRFSYRRYPEFLQYYDQHKDSERFVDIEENYFGV